MTATRQTRSPDRRAALRILMLAVAALGPTVGAMADTAPGTFGFVAKVDADGIFNPRLKSVLVQSVTPGLPAAVAGVVAGDSVLEVEGKPVAGALASDMAKLMKKSPGETLVLKLGRSNGEAYSVRLTAVTRP